ncbi:MAG: hypothetical protein E7539_06350 [Ruminococcaceae bacterium]|nr:hypothetical protein [Oscillospiraceae bacterium]
MKITAQQAAEKWNVSLRRVQDYCKNGKIEGAERFGLNWMIPADAPKPMDGRSKAAKTAAGSQTSLLRKSPFLDMTDLYNEPGSADKTISQLSYNKHTQTLFEAAVSYSRGEIDKVFKQAQSILNDHSEFYAVVSGGVLLSLVAMWKGDIKLWHQARRHITEAPCRNDVDRDIIALSVAAADSAIRNTNDFPKWFLRGCFDNLPRDAHPAARVYYVKHLIIMSQELAMGNKQMEDVQGFALMKTLPFVIEPMISQMVVDKVILAEIYLRLMCGLVCHQSGDEETAIIHIDKAIRLCLADGFYGPLVEHRRQLGTFLDDRIALIDADALKKVKDLHKQLHTGWTKLHNAVLKKTVAAHLSPREREVSRLVAYGLSDSQIAGRLYISESSVKAIVRSAKNKTGVEKRKQLIDFI